jgi:glutamate N-acetyltransferase/amino-acid N-acetyltransferase
LTFAPQKQHTHIFYNHYYQYVALVDKQYNYSNKYSSKPPTNSGGKSESECKNVAFAVAESPLVKTALFAADANWGRVLAAVGRAIDSDTPIEDIDIKFGEHSIVANGLPADHDEDKLNDLLLLPDIEINIALGKSQEDVTVWSCDLSYDYVRINAEYRS